MEGLLTVLLMLAGPDTLPEKIPGLVGPYHPFDGYVYSGEGVAESTKLHDAFNFGLYGRINEREYGYNFPLFIHNSCEAWNVNRLIAISRPPSENGVVNNPADTSIWNPDVTPPGMIQGARRFSVLARRYPQIYGLTIDDFYGNYPSRITAAQLLDIRDALWGKYVDSAGNVHHDSPPSTTWLKLYICLYEQELSRNPDTTLLRLADGVNFWIWNQNANYPNFSSYISTVRTKYPDEEIIPGIYLHNSLADMTQASINYILERSLDMCDDGSARGVLVFAGHWMVMNNISRARWDAMALPHEFNTVYYPYLGKGAGTVYQDSSDAPAQDAWLTVWTEGRVTLDTFQASRQRSDSLGAYRFGAWAGNRTTDSTRYWIVAEKPGYIPDTVSGWVRRQQLTVFPDLHLRLSGVGRQESAADLPRLAVLSLAPNPSAGRIRISYALPAAGRAKLLIFDRAGREVAKLCDRRLPAGRHSADWRSSEIPSGVYVVRLQAGDKVLTSKFVLR